jgi:hypothetical protein
MTEQDLYLRLADSICQQMDKDHRAYSTKTRAELTTLLRNISNQPRSRIGRAVGDAIEAALDQKGFRMFPSINAVGALEAVRIIRRGTFVDKILNAFLHPGGMTDGQLADVIAKAKQQDMIRWNKGEAAGAV